jgi:replicative DNA helicase
MTTFETTASLLADAELEAQLVAALATQPAIVEQARDILTRDAFTDAALADAFTALLDGRPVTPPADTIPAQDPLAAAQRLADLSGGRRLAGVPAMLGGKLLDLSRGTTTLAAVLSDFTTAASQGVEAATPTMPLQPSGALVASVLADAARRADHLATTGSGIIGLRTGLDRLDEMTGGMEGNTLTVLLARPNAGKTTLCNGWAYRVAQDGAPVLFVSFENPPDDLVRKHLVRIAGLSASDVMRGRGNLSMLDAAAQVYQRDVGDRLYYVAATASTNVAAIATMAYRIRRRHPDAPPPLIVLDYLQKLATRPSDEGGRGAGYDDLRGNVARVTQELRDIARALHAPVLTVSSVNRAAYATDAAKPTAASAKESGSIEFDADVLLALADDKDEGNLPMGVRPVRLDVIKNRYGQTGSVSLAFNGAQGRFDPRDVHAPTIGAGRAG